MIPLAPPILCLCPLTPVDPHHFLCIPSSPSLPCRSSRPLHSLSVLAFDQERLERKVGACHAGLSAASCRAHRLAHSPLCTLQILALRQARRPVPPEVAQQYQDVVQRSQWQRAQLEQGGAALRRGRSRNGAGKEWCVWRGRVKKGAGERYVIREGCVQRVGN